jgi:hypothetical protein
MLKYLAIFTVVIGLAVYVTVQDEHYANNSTQEPTLLRNSVSPRDTNEEQPPQNVAKSKGNPPSWHSFFTWPNGTGAWAIFLTLFAIVEQSNHTARQARNMVNRERARLTIIFPPGIPMANSGKAVDRESKAFLFVAIAVDLINDGTTKAFNVKASGRLTIADSKEQAFAPLAVDPLEIPKVIGDANTEHPVRLAISPLGGLAMIPGVDWKAVESGKKFLRMTGLISYDDIFEEERRETPFHFQWDAGISHNSWPDSPHWVDLSPKST